ncbi:hypothetical protein SAMN05216326_1682 [Nitrosomonas marina]|uniref:Uncharacterized protein n=1 Tax=Nitrosomonas marina TaxID=917 RepID=A0A1I0GH90_9PROT|nr:hypothetical protein [Nitrosomonas marina]SET69401.1 hypothetical protein SAMN05216326_1682 [Nitrosomonas marina]
MDEVMSWIIDNKEWIFSGAGIALIANVIRKKKGRSNQSIKSGRNTTNIQVGNDLNIENKIKKK